MPPTRRTPIQHFGRRSRLSPKAQRNNFLLLSSPLTTAIGTKRTLKSINLMSAFEGKAELPNRARQRRKTLKPFCSVKKPFWNDAPSDSIQEFYPVSLSEKSTVFAALPYVCYWHFGDIARSQIDFRFRWKSGRAADITAMTESDPELT